MEEKRQEQWQEWCRIQQEEDEERKALEIQEEDLKLEMQKMAEEGYQEKVNTQRIPSQKLNTQHFNTSN